MIYILENENVRIEIDSLGAELKSIYNKKNGLNYMWDSSPKFWKRSSPILFPNVGKYYNGIMRYDGKEYKQSQHGFARDLEFNLLSKTDDVIWFYLNSNEETLEKYPFKFELQLGYKIEDNNIDVLWRVLNKDDKKIYFAIGGHPAFNCPLINGERKKCYFHFEGVNEITSTKINSAGYASFEKINYKLDNGYLKMDDEIFANDAIVLENGQVHEVSICGADKKPYITVKMTQDMFGLWTPSLDAPFVCIEPWCGRCDDDGFVGDITERYGEELLEVNGIFDKKYTISIF